MMPKPVITGYEVATGRAIIAHGEHLSSWMSVDDLFAQAFAWFDVARELRARNLAVEAANAIPATDDERPDIRPIITRPRRKHTKRGVA